MRVDVAGGRVVEIRGDQATVLQPSLFPLSDSADDLNLLITKWSKCELMKLGIQELSIKAEQVCARTENYELFHLIVESVKHNDKSKWDDGAYSFVSTLFFILLVFILLLLCSNQEYFKVFFLESLMLSTLIYLAVRHSTIKGYFMSVNDKYCQLFDVLKSDACRWNDFKTYLVTEREIYISRNPIIHRNIDKLLYFTLVIFVFENTIRPKAKLLKYVSTDQYDLTLAILLILPMAYFLFTSCKIRKFDRVKALLEMISKYEDKKQRIM